MGKILRFNIVKVTPVLDTSIYADGDRIGSIQELGSAVANIGGFSVLESISVVDQAAQDTALDLLFFDEAPTVASADNAAIDIAAAELEGKFLGMIQIVAADYKVVKAATNSVATVKDLDLLLKATGSATSVFVVMVVRSGTPTYLANSLVFNYGLKQD